jgi:hypothetical protein
VFLCIGDNILKAYPRNKEMPSLLPMNFHLCFLGPAAIDFYLSLSVLSSSVTCFASVDVPVTISFLFAFCRQGQEKKLTCAGDSQSQ